VNYADRASLSITKGKLSADLHLDTVSWVICFRLGVVVRGGANSIRLAAGPLRIQARLWGGVFSLVAAVFVMGFAGFLKGRAAFVVLFALLFLAGFALAPPFRAMAGLSPRGFRRRNGHSFGHF